METFLEAWAVVGAVVVAMLMVSNVAYPHLTKQMIRGKRGAPWPVVLVLLISVVALKEATLVLAFWFYAIVFLARAIYLRATHRDAIDDVVRH